MPTERLGAGLRSLHSDRVGRRSRCKLNWPWSGTDLSRAIHRAAPDRLSDHAHESDFGRGL